MPVTSTDSGSGRRYDFLNVLGRGGFGTVYRAWMRGEGGFDKLVAIKIPNDERADPTEVARLKDEARMLGLLRHRCIVGVDGLALLDGRWSVVMEYVDGVDLRSLLKATGPLPIGVSLQIIAEVAGALDAAWEAEDVDGQPMTLMHRDIKPSNIMITATADVKVLDFGIARAHFETRESITENRRLGSQYYMAPERLDLMDHATSDIYSLGAVLFAMITGKRIGRTSAAVATHVSVMQAAMVHLRKSSAFTNLDLMDLLQAMLRYSPDARPKARHVERRCHEILAKLSEPNLRSWAKRIVPPILQTRMGSDLVNPAEAWTGSTWADATEGSNNASEQATMSETVQVAPMSRSPVWAVAGLATIALWSISLVVFGSWWVLWPVPTQPVSFVPLSEAVAEKPASEPEEAASEPDEAPVDPDPADHTPEGDAGEK